MYHNTNNNVIFYQSSVAVFECSFGSLNVLYVYIDKVHITMTYKKHIRILFMEHSYDRRRCYEPHVLSPLRVHRISSTDNTLKPLIYSNMYVFCDVSSRIYNIIILHAFLCVPKVQLF